MSFTPHRRLGLLGLLAVLAAVVATIAVVSTSSAASRATTVTLSEYKLAVSPRSVTHGKVTFTVKNTGDMEHELVVIRTSKAAAKLPVSSNRASERGAVGEVEDIAGGKRKTLTLALKKGHYALICNLNGHYQGGMHADFTVK